MCLLFKMQKYWLPFRKSESLGESKPLYNLEVHYDNKIKDSSRLPLTRASERHENVLHSSRNDRSKPESFSRSTTVTVNQQGFKTARENNNLLNRKRASNETSAEPVGKKFQPNVTEANIAKKESTSDEIKRPVLSGDVTQILKIKKEVPPNLNPFYEVYANVFNVEQSKAGRKILLLRNHTGPVIQGIFHEIDMKMIEVKPGDAVRCVGNFINNSRFHIFKISVMNENPRKLVNRLHTLTNFEVARNAASKAQ